jgi:dipeptidyl aminopeptidase/acylaminoacyl peptidase
VPYLVPGDDIVAVIDASPTPLVRSSPDERYCILIEHEPHPPISMLARPMLPLAGLRLDPALKARQRTRRCSGMRVLDVSDGAERALALPAGAQVSTPVWSPDSRRIVFTVDEADGVGVWTCDVAGGGDPVPIPRLRVRDVLGADPPMLGGTIRWSRDSRTLLVLADPAQPAPPARPDQVEPRIEETAGKRSQMATFQDLLRTPADEDRFEALATTIPLRVDPVSGESSRLGPPGLYQYLDESPDGAYLLVYRLRRPFSFRVPYVFFARSSEVWSAAGQPAAVIADLPVSDEVPRMGVPTGPRRVSWDERAPARLLWVEALDGGDPIAQVPHRDVLLRLDAPFDGAPEEVTRIAQRCVGWMNLEAENSILLTEHDRDRRWLTTWLCDLSDPDRRRVVFDLSEDDAYNDPGTALTRLHPDGTRTVRQRGPAIYLRGDGATPEGERPFLDLHDLETGEVTRLFRSAPDAYQHPVCLTGDQSDQAVIWHESPSEPPNLLVVPLLGDRPVAARALTAWPDPHPEFTGITKQLVVSDRGDGVPLSGMLHLPPGYDQRRDGRLPLVIWAYPHDYGSADTAGQIRGSTQRFTWLTAADPAWFALRGYAVLANATMPVIGDPETKNDTYVEQISAAARAHIDRLVAMGVADPARVAVGGHSYGAFMTATLLVHTDLFAAGIARSGAYNRSLTPFGFQTERRSFWEVPQVYDRVSPFRYADRLSAPILLIHGANDSNSGTFPVQSERFFQAIQGNGGVARLVILPLEDHGYRARESVLHVLAEEFDWLERWLGPATSFTGDQPASD